MLIIHKEEMHQVAPNPTSVYGRNLLESTHDNDSHIVLVLEGNTYFCPGLPMPVTTINLQRRQIRNVLMESWVGKGRVTEVALVESLLGPWTECMEALDPCLRLLLTFLVVRIDVPRPWPVPQSVWEVDNRLCSSTRHVQCFPGGR